MVVIGQNAFSDALDRIIAGAEARDTRTPERRAADAARRETEGRAYAERLAAERLAFLARAPRYAMPGGGAGRSSALTGSLRTGTEGDQGRRLHIVAEEDCGSWCATGTALCGATPGRRSHGWGDVRNEPADCPRCLARLAGAGA
ncbi:hypothetical protein [Methylorubrum aminovorans]